MTRLQRFLFWISTALVSLSGLAYFVMKYLLPRPDAFSVINHPWQPWMLKLHVLTAPLFVFAFGVIIAIHASAHYRSNGKCGRKSGMANWILGALAIASGYLLPVLTERTWISATAWTHIVISSLFVLALGLHMRAALKRRSEGKNS